MNLLKILILVLFTPYFLFSIPFSEKMMEEGHAVYVTKSADETHEWKLRLIKDAKRSLEISTGYCMGRVFEELLQAVLNKLANEPQVKIHMIFFQVLDFIQEDQLNFLATLKEKYPDRYDYHIAIETSLINQEGKAYVTENHTKLIIMDENYFLLGGTNLIDSLSTANPQKYPRQGPLPANFLPEASFDTDAIIKGPMAKKLRKEFFELFSLHKSNEELQQALGEYKPISTNYFPVDESEKAFFEYFETNPDVAHGAKVYALIAGPRLRLHTIGNIYESIINQAQFSIDIGNMYFFPRDSIYEALIQAVNRNVSLSLVTNGIYDELTAKDSIQNLYGHINRMNYLPIMAGRSYKIWECFTALSNSQKDTQVFEFNIPGTLFHKKIMTVDHRYSIVGSYNLGMKSEDAAYEVVAVIDSPEVALETVAILKNDQMHSNPISYERAMGWYFNPYYNIIESFEKKFFDGILI